MTAVYLAYGGAEKTFEIHRDDAPIDLLVAFPLLKSFQKNRSKYNVRRWVLDSGAFSVHTIGKKIEVDDYIAASRDVDAAEIFGLDIIGDPLGTRRNLERMWAAGIDAIPTIHYGSGADDLKWCCAHASKIALGGVARMQIRPKTIWLGQCFGLAWPKKIHGFGCVSRSLLEAFPFDSVDASTWRMIPSGTGGWEGYGRRRVQLGARHSQKDFWVEVAGYQRRAREAAQRWHKQLSLLGSI